MFLLILLPLAWGYLLAGRVLRESQRWFRWSLAYALGLLSLLIGVNAFFYWLPLRSAVYVTALLLGLGAALLARLTPPAAQAPGGLGRFEGPVLAILALTAFFEALFWQMQWSDDDFFIHAPVMALFLRDVFPTQNPYFPDLPLITHYGRDLSVSSVSVLFGERFLTVQYFVTAANQAAAVLVAHFTARRFLRSPAQALWAVLFAFAGLNFDSRRGLLETFQNNNSFAFLFLFVNIYLLLTALTRRSRVAILISGVALGTYAFIYESSFGLLCMTFAAFPLVLCALRMRWRRRYFAATAGILLIAGGLALIEGGMITGVVRRHLLGQTTGAPLSEEDRLMSRELKIRIPKPGFTITGAFRGDEYPLWSPRLAEDAGMFLPLLPITGGLMLLRRKPWGIVIAGLSAIAVLIPAGVDFGTYNAESLRFLIVGGVGASMLLGVTLGMLWEAARARGATVRAAAAMGIVGIAALSVWPSAQFAYGIFRAAALYPRDHYLVAEEWGCTVVLPRRPCEPVDVMAAVALQPFIHKGDRVLANFRDDEPVTVMLAQATFITFARAFLAGPGLRPLPPGTRSQTTPLWEGEGFRARAFFGTGEADILDDLGVRYVSVNPANLTPDIYARIQREPRLERVVHVESPGGGAVREVYRVRPVDTAPEWTPSDRFAVISVRTPPGMEARRLYPVTLLFSGDGRPAAPRLHLSYEIRLMDGRLANANDEVRLPVVLHPDGSGRRTGTLWLATPYEPGTYDVHLFGWDGARRQPLRDGEDRPAIVRIRVS